MKVRRGAGAIIGLSILTVLISGGPAGLVVAQAQSPIQITADERLKNAKASYPSGLGEFGLQAIENQCVASQVTIKQTTLDYGRHADAVQVAHQSVIARLGTLKTLLVSGSKQADPVFDQLIVDYSLKLDELKTSHQTVLAYLTDSSNIDCVTDPEGFRSLLSAAQASDAVTRVQEMTLKDYMNKVAKARVAELTVNVEAGQ